MLRKKIEFYVIDGYKVAREAGMGTRINTIMQTCFFAISGVLPRDEAIAQIKKSIKKTYGKRGEAVVEKNFAAVDHALAHLEKVELPAAASSSFDLTGAFSAKAPKFVHDVLGEIAAGKGDLIPVSAIPAGGAFPSGTAQWEKRNIAQFIPVWDKDLCIQCGKCVMVCPHAVIRAKIYNPELGDKAPATFKWAKPKWKGMEEQRYTLQVAPEDCTGCAVCVEVCPVKNKSDASKKAINMAPQAPLREPERENWEFFLALPEVDRVQAFAHAGEGPSTAAAALRVLGRLRGLRRNGVHQAAHAVVRRPAVHRQRHGLLVDLRRQPADHALYVERAGPRADVVQLAL